MKTKILLVEDNPATMEVMHQELEVLGYDVAIARDGGEAVEMAGSELPDLIIMDMLMPKMDGSEATGRIRKNPKTKAIPILAATAKALPEDRDICLASGCDDYIAKPFSYRELHDAIEKLLKRQSE